MSAMRACAPTEPVMVVWKKYQESEDFANSKKWAAFPEHVQDSLWAAFSEGFRVATERAAMLHESVMDDQISPIEVIARHLAEDDSAYSDMEEARLAAQRILDVLLHAGWLVQSFQSEVKRSIERGIASANAS